MGGRRLAALAGVVAVAAALAVGELLAGLVDGVPSLVTSVGAVLVPFVPPALESWAIQTFGTSDKAVLNAGTVVLTLAVGAVAGVRGPRGGARIIGVLGAVGLMAALASPLRAPAATLLAIGAVVAVGVLTLRRLLRRLPATPATEASDAPAAGGDERAEQANDASRRSFLTAAVGALAAAGVVAVAGRALTRRRAGDIAAAARDLPQPSRALPPVQPAQAFSDVEGLTPILVPNDRFYRIDTALSVPRIDVDTWSLRITGMVEEEVELTYDDLLGMRLVERDVTLSCVSNEVGGDLVGNARWLGVPLVDVLELAGVQDGASQLVGRSVDGWTAGFPTEVAFDGRESLVAVGMNGEPLPRQHGYPARLVVPGLYGYVSATKWLTEIELTTLEAFDAYWVPRGWSKLGPVKMSSRIDVPRSGASVPAGATRFAGVAWDPAVGVQAVELRIDDGEWVPCETTEPLADTAWVQWKVDVDLAAGDHIAEVRMTNAAGDLQVQEYAPPRPDGATGWHSVRVRVRDA
ncbi:MAG: molybdopterin-dependent oxidoreductase [Actinobacteria bacterium]|nr:molybdopterin-dependent oxidoreductase [Actinomycetota bacterium]